MQISITEYIKDIIKREGPITIARYMSIVSYHKSLGYYENHEIGSDFITSPQISKAFGGLIGLFFLSFYYEHYNKDKIIFVELGAGNGELMSSILEIFSQIPSFIANMTIYIVECSSHLISIQKEKLQRFRIKINWVKDIGLINIDKPVFFISNEFFDCLPIHQFFYNEDGLAEISVNHNMQNNEFHFCFNNKLSHIHYYIKKSQLINNQIIEISPSCINIIKYINSSLANFGGISVIIDYGSLNQTGKSTLQTISKHKIMIDVDIFDINTITKNLKDLDISAHVNFSSIIENMTNCQNEFYTQHEFFNKLQLNKLKINSKITNILSKLDKNKHNEIGNLFKVLISKNTTNR
jgi:SAM-dependent MidA family methyltransferase